MDLKITGVARIIGDEAAVGAGQRIPAKAAVNSAAPSETAGAAEVQMRSKSAKDGGNQPAELLLGARPQSALSLGLAQTYVRMRFDDGSRSVMIQIIDASTDEVVKEIPPDAWERLKASDLLPRRPGVQREI